MDCGYRRNPHSLFCAEDNKAFSPVFPSIFNLYPYMPVQYFIFFVREAYQKKTAYGYRTQGECHCQSSDLAGPLQPYGAYTFFRRHRKPVHILFYFSHDHREHPAFQEGELSAGDVRGMPFCIDGGPGIF